MLANRDGAVDPQAVPGRRRKVVIYEMDSSSGGGGADYYAADGWSINVVGLDESEAALLLEVARARFGKSGHAVSPKAAFALSLDVTAARALFAALSQLNLENSRALRVREYLGWWLSDRADVASSGTE